MINLFEIPTTHLFMFSLIFFRMSSLIVTMPFFGGDQIPHRIRLAFVIGFSFVMYNTLSMQGVVLPTTIYGYVSLIARELGFGIMLGYIASIVFFGVQFGGELIAIQMGLTQSQALDPLSSDRIPVIGQFFTFFVMTVFLLANGHHYLLQVFVDSFTRVPISQVHYSTDVFDFAIKSFSVILTLGLQIGMPAMIMVFSLTVALAFVARLVPQMNVFILSLPFKIGGGLIITSICLPLVVIMFRDKFHEVLDMMYKMIAIM